MTAPVPRGFVPRLFDFDGPALFGFPGSWPVTPDGSVIALPTPGHSPGHTSYLVRRAEGDVLLAGDVTYDLPALESQRDQGFIANVERHHDTLRRVLGADASIARVRPADQSKSIVSIRSASMADVYRATEPLTMRYCGL